MNKKEFEMENENIITDDSEVEKGEIELQVDNEEIETHFKDQRELDPEEEAFKNEDDEEGGLQFKYSRATNRPIHFGKYIPFFKDSDGIPSVLIGPDCNNLITQL